jgi:hypothetical protein
LGRLNERPKRGLMETPATGRNRRIDSLSHAAQCPRAFQTISLEASHFVVLAPSLLTRAAKPCASSVRRRGNVSWRGAAWRGVAWRARDVANGVAAARHRVGNANSRSMREGSKLDSLAAPATPTPSSRARHDRRSQRHRRTQWRCTRRARLEAARWQCAPIRRAR